VQSICDRVIVLARGRVRLCGSIAELTRPAHPTHRLEGEGPLEELVRLLSARGLPARLESRPGAAGAAILLDPPGPERIGLVWSAARAAGVVVRSLEPAQRPFEEVFMGALREADQADAREREARHAAS
jgi:ABC-type multidrug transport system ATPase subunit